MTTFTFLFSFKSYKLKGKREVHPDIRIRFCLGSGTIDFSLFAFFSVVSKFSINRYNNFVIKRYFKMI